jgi:hypothetical protein
MNIGTLSVLDISIIFAICWAVLGVTRISAGPPILK